MHTQSTVNGRPSHDNGHAGHVSCPVDDWQLPSINWTVYMSGMAVVNHQLDSLHVQHDNDTFTQADTVLQQGE